MKTIEDIHDLLWKFSTTNKHGSRYGCNDITIITRSLPPSPEFRYDQEGKMYNFVDTNEEIMPSHYEVIKKLLQDNIGKVCFVRMLTYLTDIANEHVNDVFESQSYLDLYPDIERKPSYYMARTRLQFGDSEEVLKYIKVMQEDLMTT